MNNAALRDMLRTPRGRRVIVIVPDPIRNHAPIRKAAENYDALLAAEKASQAELGALVETLKQAEAAHLDAFATALADGRPEPRETKAEKLQVAHAKLERKVAALSIAIDAAETALVEIVEAERGNLAADADQQATAARERVKAAVTEYAAARAELVAHEGLTRWLDRFPAGSGKNTTTGIPPIRRLLGQNGEPTPFEVVVDALVAETSPPVPAAPTFIREPATAA